MPVNDEVIIERGILHPFSSGLATDPLGRVNYTLQQCLQVKHILQLHVAPMYDGCHKTYRVQNMLLIQTSNQISILFCFFIMFFSFLVTVHTIASSEDVAAKRILPSGICLPTVVILLKLQQSNIFKRLRAFAWLKNSFFRPMKKASRGTSVFPICI